MESVTMAIGRHHRSANAVSISSADALRSYAERIAAEVESRRRLFEKDYSLRNKLYEPLLRAASAEDRAAADARAAADRKAFKERVKAAKPAKIQPDVISTQPGAQQAFPPYDGTWTNPSNSGSNFLGADQTAGWLSISLSPTGSQCGAAGLELFVFPASRTDSLIIQATMVCTGSCDAHSYFFGSAAASASVELLVFAFDNEGNHLPEFDQQQQFQICSASASGLYQSAGGALNLPNQFPLVTVSGGDSYAAWMILRNESNTGGNGQADSDIQVTVPWLIIVES
jgi:hypothetical protein